MIIIIGMENSSSKAYFSYANEKCERFSKNYYRFCVGSLCMIFIPAFIVTSKALLTTGLQAEDYALPFFAWWVLGTPIFWCRKYFNKIENARNDDFILILSREKKLWCFQDGFIKCCGCKKGGKMVHWNTTWNV